MNTILTCQITNKQYKDLLIETAESLISGYKDRGFLLWSILTVTKISDTFLEDMQVEDLFISIDLYIKYNELTDSIYTLEEIQSELIKLK